MIPIDMLPLGQTVLLWRLSRGLTQDQLARQAGISRPNLSMIEQEGRDVTVRTLRRLARALAVSPGMLVDGILPEALSRKKLSRESLDRIARWLVTEKEKFPRPRLEENEKEMALWIQSLTKRRRNQARNGGRSLPRTARKEEKSFLHAKLSLGPSEINNLLSRIQKHSPAPS